MGLSFILVAHKEGSQVAHFLNLCLCSIDGVRLILGLLCSVIFRKAN